MPLTVGPGALGTPETEWLRRGVLDRLPRWRPDGPTVAHVLVVAPHPDDEVLGAGGTIQILAAGGAVIDVLAVTDGEAAYPGSTPSGRVALAARRARERSEALRRLGVVPRRIVRMGLPDGEVATSEPQLAAAIAGLCRPATLVLAPWCHDGHPDHDSSGRAAVSACAEAGADLLCYLFWAWHWADPGGGQIPLARARRVELARRARAAKRWATCAYDSQTGPPDGDPAAGPVLPPTVLRRAWRSFEILLPGAGDV